MTHTRLSPRHRPARPGRAKPQPAGRGTYSFRLFVAGYEPNSTQARTNLARLCDDYLPGRYRIEVVDVFKDTASALEHRVIVTPTLLVTAPNVKVTLLGNLSDTDDVLAALQLNGEAR